MNFEICMVSRGKLGLHGFMDEADFLAVADGKEAFQINTMYDVTQGNIIFKITNTNIQGDMLIIAKDVKVQLVE